MRKATLFSLIFLFVGFSWFIHPVIKQAEAITSVYLVSPSDSIKLTTGAPTFEWGAIRDPGLKEIIREYHIVVATDFDLNAPWVWEGWTHEEIDTIRGVTVPPKREITYDGPAFDEWKTYFWSVQVKVDSITGIDTIIIDTITVEYDTAWHRDIWYRLVRPRTLLYSTATLIEIPDSLAANGFDQSMQTIQVGIAWSTNGDTVLVKPGTYYENIWSYKKGVILASHFTRDGDTTTIKNTILDGSKSTRGQGKGSVIYFTSRADSNSGVIGFTITNGTGTEGEVGPALEVSGGGIFCAPGSTPTIAYNVITQNRAADDGGGIFCYSAAPNIFRNIIVGNSAGGSGGAIKCRDFIRTLPSTVSRPPGGERGKKGIEAVREGSPTSQLESNSRTKADNLENSLYPRDATEVLPALSSDPLAKPAQGNPPVAILEYHVRRGTVVEREKILEGDTVVFDASASFDPDSLEGDSVWRYKWGGRTWRECETADAWGNYIVTSATNDKTVEKAVPIEMEGGRYKIWVTAVDNDRLESTSDTVYLNVQRPPRADAGEDTVIAPGDTAWLDGSGSCDINPDDDTVLTYLWSWVDGPKPVSLLDSTAVTTFFVPDESYGGAHTFALKTSDSDTFSVDTARVIVDRYPEAMTFDSLAGFPAEVNSIDTSIVVDTIIVDSDTTFDSTTVIDTTAIPTPLPLDASQSFDPDTLFGDSVLYFIWEGISHTACPETVVTFLTIDTDSIKIDTIIVDSDTTFDRKPVPVQYIPANRGGGVYKLALHVRDRFGVRSKEADTLVISVQLRPSADAGPDTVMRPGKGHLYGSACEPNWDQADSLTYEWHQDERDSIPVTLFEDPAFGEENSKAQEVWFQINASGILHFTLTVLDPYSDSYPDDSVRVIVNRFPQIDSVLHGIRPVEQCKFAEGGDVVLRVFAHDEDAGIYGDSLIYNWTFKNWPNYPDPTYKPEVMSADLDTVRFVPLRHGEYQLEIVVHDTLSENYQIPSVDPAFNIRTYTIRVDTTFAYPLVTENLISFNTAGSKGGGIDCFQSSPDIINNIFYSNESGSSGGAICSRFDAHPFIERNIFFGNVSGNSTGGGIADLRALQSPAATIGFRPKTEVCRNAFWDNSGGDFYQRPASTFDNIYLYPRLIDPEYGNFRLDCSSPCLDDGIGLLQWLYPELCGTAPPVTMISLSLFQHPVTTAVANFLINTDAPLKAPPVGYVTIGVNSPAPVDFTSISSTTFRGNFVFCASDTAHISILASSVQEQDTSIIRDFAVQLIGAGKVGRLVSHDNQLAVLFPRGAVKGDVYATCIPVSDDPRYNFTDEDKVALGEAYQVGPLVDFDKELTISFPLHGHDLSEKDSTLFSIYRHDKDGWESQPSFLDENSVCARVRGLGVYRLVYDADQERIAAIPKSYELLQNYPNPFNPQTVIRYDLPDPGHVKVVVYNILGQKVKILVDEHKDAGRWSVDWKGKDDQGKEVASGIYFYKIEAAKFEKTKKMVLLK